MAINIVERAIMPYNGSGDKLLQKEEYALFAPMAGVDKVGMAGYSHKYFTMRGSNVELSMAFLMTIQRHQIVDENTEIDGIKEPNTFYSNFSHGVIDRRNADGSTSSKNVTGNLLVTRSSDDSTYSQNELFIADGRLWLREIIVIDDEVSEIGIFEPIFDKHITTDEIANNSVTNDKLANNSVTKDKIANDSVTKDKLINSSVSTEKIEDRAITRDKLTNSSVNQDKLADGAVGTSELQDHAVNISKLDASITEKLESIEALAKEKQKGVSFSDYKAVVDALNGITDAKNKGEYIVGQSIYIKDVEVPDLWIFSVTDTYKSYEYIDNDTFLKAITDGANIGYYKVAVLETTKVDLSGYATLEVVSKLPGLKLNGNNEIFNDYVLNSAGAVGYYYKAVDFTNKKIYLGRTNIANDGSIVRPVSITSDNGYVDTEFGDTGYRVGDTFTIFNNTNYLLCGTIEDISDNVITVSSLPFTEIYNGDDLEARDFMFFVPDKPYAPEEVGNLYYDVAGGYSSAGGLENRAPSHGSRVDGKGNTVYGDYGVSAGRNNKVGYAANADGRECEIMGEYSNGGGYKAETSARFTTSRGIGTVADGRGQSSFGTYNKRKSGALFSVGNGSDDAHRSDAMDVMPNGDAIFGGKAYIEDGTIELATKPDVEALDDAVTEKVDDVKDTLSDMMSEVDYVLEEKGYVGYDTVNTSIQQDITMYTITSGQGYLNIAWGSASANTWNKVNGDKMVTPYLLCEFEAETPNIANKFISLATDESVPIQKGAVIPLDGKTHKIHYLFDFTNVEVNQITKTITNVDIYAYVDGKLKSKMNTADNTSTHPTTGVKLGWFGEAYNGGRPKNSIRFTITSGEATLKNLRLTEIPCMPDESVLKSTAMTGSSVYVLKDKYALTTDALNPVDRYSKGMANFIRDSGVPLVDGMFAMSVDENGNLYVHYNDDATPPTFEYDSSTGDLYYVINE